jgi:hypothetical protein
LTRETTDERSPEGDYFTSANGSTSFSPTTTQALTHGEWTPVVVEACQAKNLALFHKEWKLN